MKNQIQELAPKENCFTFTVTILLEGTGTVPVVLQSFEKLTVYL
jgi:hypothetical protein